MLAPETVLECNRRDVTARVVDGEAILMNITTGAYYSTDRVGGMIWELIEGGYSVGQIASTVAAAHEVEASTAESDVQRLAGELLDAGLVGVVEGASLPAPPSAPADKQAYVSPQLQGYDDMSELLALDPPMPSVGGGGPAEA